MCRINKKQPDELTNEILELRAESEDTNNTGEKWGLLQVVRSSEMRIILLLVCFLQAGQQTSGINAVKKLELSFRNINGFV